MARHVVAHVLGAIALGALEAARLGGGALAMAIVPLFAMVGLVAALAIGVCGRRALVVALPSLVVTVPVCHTLFDGAYAQTLPLAAIAPYALPVVAYLIIAGLVWAGAKIGDDKMWRATALLGAASALGGVVWIGKHVIGRGYPDAHAGGTVAAIVLAGICVKLAYAGGFPRVLGAILAAATLGAFAGALLYGLRDASDRVRLDAIGDGGRDLVRIFRWPFDRDGDGASTVLGGGDCDDSNKDIHPGAIDKPGDGIDQDCDGVDAVAPPKPVIVVAPPKPSIPKDLPIVLITVDALRADLLAAGAPHRDDFPNLAKLLDQSVWFTRAIAPASSTDVSLSTILTGRLDPYQRVETTLLEALQATGRRTFVAMPGEVTRYVGDVLINRGADKLVTVNTDWAVADVGDHVSAGSTTGEAIKAINGGATAVWVHYFDVHEHHQIKVPPELLAQVHDVGGGPVALGYRALLHAIDGEVGALLAKAPANAIVIFASDHGESLGEDPRLGETHGRVAYAPLVRIPLALRVPGVAPAVREEPASLVDLAPTICALTGATMPSLDGVDLLGSVPVRPIVIHEEWQWSVVAWPYQLLEKPQDNLIELYDLSTDPREQKNLARPDLIQRLAASYAASPPVHVDRTPAGRSFREAQAQPLRRRAPASGSAATATP